MGLKYEDKGREREDIKAGVAALGRWSIAALRSIRRNFHLTLRLRAHRDVFSPPFTYLNIATMKFTLLAFAASAMAAPLVVERQGAPAVPSGGPGGPGGFPGFPSGGCRPTFPSTCLAL